MPLTPADVRHMAFKKAVVGRRGYDEEEVDAFLDEVERDLARLIEENAALRALAGDAPATDSDHQHEALRVLEAAQRDADARLGDARRAADRLLFAAHAEANEVTARARSTGEALDRHVRQQHDETVGTLDTVCAALQRHISELRRFEQEHDAWMRTYLQEHLLVLDERPAR